MIQECVGIVKCSILAGQGFFKLRITAHMQELLLHAGPSVHELCTSTRMRVRFEYRCVVRGWLA